MSVSKKMAIIGTRDTVLPFGAVGVEKHIANNSEEAEKILDNIILQGYGIIFIEEKYAESMSEKIDKLSIHNFDVSIMVIPGSKGGSGYGKIRINNLVLKAIGMDIVNKE